MCDGDDDDDEEEGSHHGVSQVEVRVLDVADVILAALLDQKLTPGGRRESRSHTSSER